MKSIVMNVSKTNVRRMSMIDSKMASQIDCENMADRKKASKTHSGDELTKSVQQPKSFELFITI